MVEVVATPYTHVFAIASIVSSLSCFRCRKFRRICKIFSFGAHQSIKWCAPKPSTVRNVIRAGVERVFGMLKDSHGGCTIRVHGHEKVFLHLMFGILVNPRYAPSGTSLNPNLHVLHGHQRRFCNCLN